jgi:hypothetical protein
VWNLRFQAGSRERPCRDRQESGFASSRSRRVHLRLPALLTPEIEEAILAYAPTVLVVLDTFEL